MYKAKMDSEGTQQTVAVKELILKNEMRAIYDFQHEITIMR